MTTQTMTQLQKKSLNTPDEVRQFGDARLETVTLGDVSIARITLEPGWKWSRDVKPLVNTDSCTVSHIQYVVSGRLMVRMDDGTEMEFQAGDALTIPPGHDAWVLGGEPCILVDFTGMKDFGRSGSHEEFDLDMELEREQFSNFD